MTDSPPPDTTATAAEATPPPPAARASMHEQAGSGPPAGGTVVDAEALSASLRSLAALSASGDKGDVSTAAAVSGALASLGDAALRLLSSPSGSTGLTPAQVSGMALGLAARADSGLPTAPDTAAVVATAAVPLLPGFSSQDLAELAGAVEALCGGAGPATPAAAPPPATATAALHPAVEAVLAAAKSSGGGAPDQPVRPSLFAMRAGGLGESTGSSAGDQRGGRLATIQSAPVAPATSVATVSGAEGARRAASDFTMYDSSRLSTALSLMDDGGWAATTADGGGGGAPAVPGGAPPAPAAAPVPVPAPAPAHPPPPAPTSALSTSPGAGAGALADRLASLDAFGTDVRSHLAGGGHAQLVAGASPPPFPPPPHLPHPSAAPRPVLYAGGGGSAGAGVGGPRAAPLPPRSAPRGLSTSAGSAGGVSLLAASADPASAPPDGPLSLAAALDAVGRQTSLGGMSVASGGSAPSLWEPPLAGGGGGGAIDAALDAALASFRLHSAADGGGSGAKAAGYGRPPPPPVPPPPPPPPPAAPVLVPTPGSASGRPLVSDLVACVDRLPLEANAGAALGALLPGSALAALDPAALADLLGRLARGGQAVRAWQVFEWARALPPDAPGGHLASTSPAPFVAMVDACAEWGQVGQAVDLVASADAAFSGRAERAAARAATPGAPADAGAEAAAARAAALAGGMAVVSALLAAAIRAGDAQLACDAYRGLQQRARGKKQDGGGDGAPAGPTPPPSSSSTALPPVPPPHPNPLVNRATARALIDLAASPAAGGQGLDVALAALDDLRGAAAAERAAAAAAATADRSNSSSGSESTAAALTAIARGGFTSDGSMSDAALLAAVGGGGGGGGNRSDRPGRPPRGGSGKASKAASAPAGAGGASAAAGLGQADAPAYNAALVAASRAGDPGAALAVYRRMAADGVHPNTRTFAALVSAVGRDAGGLARLVASLPKPGPTKHAGDPDADGPARGDGSQGGWQAGRRWVDVPPSDDWVDPAAAAVAAPSSPPHTLSAADRRRRGSPTRQALAALMNACEKAGQWDVAHALADAAADAGIAPDVGILNSVIAACAHGGDADRAAAAFAGMAARGVAPDAVSYANLIRAYKKAGRPGDALATYEAMVSAGARAHTAVVSSMVDMLWSAASGWAQAQAVAVYDGAVAAGSVPPPAECVRKGTLKVDLGALTAGAALVATGAWLARARAAADAPPGSPAAAAFEAVRKVAIVNGAGDPARPPAPAPSPASAAGAGPAGGGGGGHSASVKDAVLAVLTACGSPFRAATAAELGAAAGAAVSTGSGGGGSSSAAAAAAAAAAAVAAAKAGRLEAPTPALRKWLLSPGADAAVALLRAVPGVPRDPASGAPLPPPAAHFAAEAAAASAVAAAYAALAGDEARHAPAARSLASAAPLYLQQREQVAALARHRASLLGCDAAQLHAAVALLDRVMAHGIRAGTGAFLELAVACCLRLAAAVSRGAYDAAAGDGGGAPPPASAAAGAPPALPRPSSPPPGPPPAEDAAASAGAPVDALLRMEANVAALLGGDLAAPTPRAFLCLLIGRLGADPADAVATRHVAGAALPLADAALRDVALATQFPPSVVGAAILVAARRAQGSVPAWPPCLAALTGLALEGGGGGGGGGSGGSAPAAGPPLPSLSAAEAIVSRLAGRLGGLPVPSPVAAAPAAAPAPGEYGGAASAGAVAAAQWAAGAAAAADARRAARAAAVAAAVVGATAGLPPL